MSILLDVRKQAGPIDVVLTALDLKVFGEGEWKCVNHGNNQSVARGG